MTRSRKGEITGIIRATRSGYAFLAPDEGGDDLLVARGALGGAIHGDRVRALLRDGYGTDYRPEVEVSEILERTRPLYTGQLRKQGKAYWVRPDSPLLPERLPVRLGAERPVPGEKILFRVENLAHRDETLIAAFERALGDADDARLDPIVISTEYGLALRFSDEALEEADARAAVASDPEDARRTDFRGQLVLTIDPIDAKDFDDAVAVERLPDGGWELSVHIADVSFYVREGSALDREALSRGTSVYFPGTVVPMLPESISSLAASLRPGEDKRVLSALIRFDARGKRTAVRFARGWIRSAARLHYAQAQAILDGDEDADPAVAAALREMLELSRLLRARRFDAGAFDLDIPEVEMVLGPDGVPREVFHHVTHPTNRLIEEFMIAANLAVGALGEEHALPLLYRVHGEPDARAIEEFILTALMLEPGTRERDLESIPALRAWLTRLPDSPRARVLHRFFLRSMKKAVYAEADIGHFGLAVRGYCHFTSPIRRYPDLWNHRRLKERIDQRPPEPARMDEARAVARQSSATEINAEQADREMARLKSARFLLLHLGEEFVGTVTALTPRGLFIELLRWPIEGFVARDGLPPGSVFLQERLSWVHERSGFELRPGDKVRVVVTQADVRMRRIDFALVGSSAKRGGSSKAAKLKRRKVVQRATSSTRRREGSAGPTRSGSSRPGSSRSGSSRPPARAGRGRPVTGSGRSISSKGASKKRGPTKGRPGKKKR